ncbi:MAG: lysylphosphatidylglycerol synthase transmembrane domain-containing protein [Gemmatimonadota bacterium]
MTEPISGPSDKASATSGTKRILHAVAVVVSLAVVVALVGVVRRDAPAAKAAWASAHVRWEWIALACASALVGQWVYVLGWQRVVRDCGVDLPAWHAARMFFASNLGRYLPGGKAWQMGIVGMMASERGLPAAVLAATSLLQGIVGVVVGALLLVITGGSALGVSRGWLIVPVFGLACVIGAPAILRQVPSLFTYAERRWPQIVHVTSWTMWSLVWTSIVNWVFWGIGLYLLARGLFPNPEPRFAAYIAAWSGPFLAGLVAVVAPAGLGVRDAAMTVMLRAAALSPGDVVVLVIIARVWGTVLEVVPAAIVLAIRGRRVRRLQE